MLHDRKVLEHSDYVKRLFKHLGHRHALVMFIVVVLKWRHRPLREEAHFSGCMSTNAHITTSLIHSK